jgi:hypothetical protein
MTDLLIKYRLEGNNDWDRRLIYLEILFLKCDKIENYLLIFNIDTNFDDFRFREFKIYFVK